MGIDAIIGTGAVSLIVLLSLIQIAPIKINPWSAIGRALNHDMMVKIDAVQEDVNALERQMVASDERLEQKQMDQCRGRILRFADEIRRHEDHSQEFFDHILSDITEYEQYCDTHPDYENEKAVNSIALIREIHQECLKEDKFL